MQKEIIHTDRAPAAVGPYSQAVRSGHLVFTAGQIALDPALGRLAGDDIDLSQVVKTTVFLQDMAHFAAMNEVYGRHFGDSPPARSTVQVAGLPLGALVEIEAVALASA
jgi:2-iminobutanoate/2-iminopropanoate deaminase